MSKWEDNLTQVAVVVFAVFEEEICLASYLSGAVGSLICLLLLSLLLLKPAVSLGCPGVVKTRSRMERGEKHSEVKHRFMSTCLHTYKEKKHTRQTQTRLHRLNETYSFHSLTCMHTNGGLIAAAG